MRRMEAKFSFFHNYSFKINVFSTFKLYYFWGSLHLVKVVFVLRINLDKVFPTQISINYPTSNFL